jgi:hypothetical protein
MVAQVLAGKEERENIDAHGNEDLLKGRIQIHLSRGE